MNSLQQKKRAFMSIVNSIPVGFERSVEADNVIALDTFKDDNLIDLKLFGKTVEIAPTDADGNIIEKSPETPWEFSSIENPTITISGRNLLDKDTMCGDNNVNRKFTVTDTGFIQEALSTENGYHLVKIYDITNIVKPNTTYYFHRETSTNAISYDNNVNLPVGGLRIYIDGKLYKQIYSNSSDGSFTTPEMFTSIDIRTYTTPRNIMFQDYDPSITYYLEWKNVYLSEVPYEEYVPYEGEPQTVEVPYTLRGLYVIPYKEDTYRTYMNDNNEAYISDAIEMRDDKVYYTKRINEALAEKKIALSVGLHDKFYKGHDRYVFYTAELTTGKPFTGYNLNGVSGTGHTCGRGRTILCNVIKSWHNTYTGSFDNDYRISSGGSPGDYESFTFFSVPKSHFPDLVDPTIDELKPLCLEYINSLAAQGNMRMINVIRPAVVSAPPVWNEIDITDTELGKALLKIKTYKYGTVISTNGHLSAKYYSNIKGVEE